MPLKLHVQGWTQVEHDGVRRIRRDLALNRRDVRPELDQLLRRSGNDRLQRRHGLAQHERAVEDGREAVREVDEARVPEGLRRRRERVFVPHTCRSQHPSGPVQLGGNASFPICPAGEVHPSKAVINGLKPRHPILRLFQFCRC